MKKYIFALTLMFAASAHSFEVTGDSTLENGILIQLLLVN